MLGQVDLRLPAELHPHTQGRYLAKKWATRGNSSELETTSVSSLIKSSSYLLMAKLTATFLIFFFPSVTVLPFSLPLCNLPAYPKPLGPCPSQGKTSGPAWASVAQGSIWSVALCNSFCC